MTYKDVTNDIPLADQTSVGRSAGAKSERSADALAATPTGAPTDTLAGSLRVGLARTALASLLGLILLCVLWETILAPLRPGGSLLLLKALPLAFAVRGVARRSLYTMQWASMLVLLYLMEGVVRAMSDPPGFSRALAWVEILLSVTFFVCAILYVRPAKQAAKRALKQEKQAKQANRASAAREST